jgi:RimJ/RimL family protein N-acetyltransferase
LDGAGLHPAPVLETERLILRGFVAGDFAAHRAIMLKPEVNAFLGPAMSDEDMWRRIVSSVGMWAVCGYGGWIVERRADGRVIGNTGIFDGRRGIGWDGQPEMGWIFDAEVHGQGYAAEACRAMLAWADLHLAGMTLWAMITPENSASLALAQRLGFTPEPPRAYKGEEMAVWSRPLGG